MKDFIIKLSQEITHTNNITNKKDKSFKDFLQLVSHESLIEYSNIVESIAPDKKQDDESLQKAITLYLLIIKKLEKPNDDKIEIDLGYTWIAALAGFITTEMLYRDGLIDGYDGFLYDGNINYRSNGKLEEFVKVNKMMV